MTAAPAPTVVVTGASGFLGGRLVKRLAAESVNIVCTTRSADVTVEDRVTWRQCDLASEPAVRDLFADVRPEIVFQLASHVSGSRDPDNVPATLFGNLVSTVNVLLAALAVDTRRVVLAGSYEEPGADAPPRSPYAAAKAGATAYSRMFASLYGLSTVVLRPAMIYGPGQRDTAKLVPYVIRAFLAQQAPVLSSGQRPVDWVYVDDVVDAFWRAATTAGIDGEVMEIGSGELRTVAEIVAMLATATGTTVDPQFGGLPDRAVEHVEAAETTKARQLLGWRATTMLDEGLQKTVDDVRATLAAEYSS